MIVARGFFYALHVSLSAECLYDGFPPFFQKRLVMSSHESSWVLR